MNCSGEPTNIALAGGEDAASFPVRWRGRQEGPYTAALIAKKLSANEIGLLHEILCNGRWIPIRDYLARQEATLRAQRQAKEQQQRYARDEHERLKREEEERNAREQEERLQLRAALLVEEQKRNEMPQQDQSAQVCCPKCGSTQITGHKQGFGVGKAVVGDLLLGPVGLLAGWIGGNQIKITCLKCGNIFDPGESRR